MDGIKRALTIDLRTLALFRVLLGSIIFSDLVMRCRDFAAFFPDTGIIPRRLAVDWFGDSTWSLYFINGSAEFAALLIGVAMLAALCVVFGYRTRTMAIVSWILLCSLQQRTAILSSGADDLLRLLLFWGIFLPLGARWSIDAALERQDPYPQKGLCNVATIALLAQASYVYWAGALLKTGSAWTTTHNAVFFALNLEQFRTPIGAWVLANFEPLLPYLTQFVYGIELYGPILLFAPFWLLYLRLPVLGFLIAMHVGFLILLNVGPFPFVSITSLLLFTPKEVWDWLGSRVNRGENIRVFYDKGCEFCLKTVCLMRVFLVLPNISVQAAQDDRDIEPVFARHDSWVVVAPDGEQHIEWDAVVWLVRQSTALGWLALPARLAGGLFGGPRLYHFIGDRRYVWGRLTRLLMPWRNTKAAFPYPLQAGIGLAALFALQINLAPVVRSVPDIHPNVEFLRTTFGLWQKWDMFAPFPLTDTRWPIIEGVRRDGSRLDLFRDQLANPARTKPKDILEEYSNYRWRKFYGRLYLAKFDYYRWDYAQYQCRRWNNAPGRAVTDLITRVEILTGSEPTIVGDAPEDYKVESQGIYDCQ
ncbi:MAG: HTTM domain-containing protein [Pseudomonadota bacterium]